MARTLQIRGNTGCNGSNTSAFALSNLKESSGVAGTFQLQSMRKFDYDIQYHVPPDLKTCLHEIQIRDLTLRSFSTSTSNIVEILKKCHHLERLHVSFKYPKHQGLVLYGMRFEPYILFQSIAHLSKTLLSLTLIDLNAGDKSPFNHDIFPRNTAPVHQLVGFHKLRSLEISRDVLFGQSTGSNSELAFRCEDLPASLSHLILHDSVDRVTLLQNLGIPNIINSNLNTMCSPFEKEEDFVERSHQEVMAEKFQKYGITVSYAFG